MIQCEHLDYRYDPQGPLVLSDLCVEIADGEFVLVVGASGTGKSTFLRCLNGLVPHFYGGEISGSVRVQGHDVLRSQPRSLSATVGFVFQEPEAQFVVDTVEAELAFAMENHNLSQAVMRKRIEEVLDQLTIAHLRHRRISTLSGGEKQRVAIASVLTLQPQVLVLDEPTSQLDPQAAEEVLTVLEKLNADLGLTVILSEHRLERVLQYADRMLYFSGAGQPVLQGEPQEVLAQISLTPPLVTLAKALDWQPLPLTLKDARRFVRETELPASPRSVHEPASASQAEVVISVEDLRHAYGRHWALQGVDLEIRRGEFVAIMGRNGSGKTTLLKHLIGLLSPTRGRVRVLGQDTREVSVTDLARHVGYVPQNPDALLFAETVRDELAFTRKNHGLPEVDPRELLTLLGLAEHVDSYPRDLSVGERQRVALAAVLVAEPEIILLDEPTRGVDYGQKQALIDYLQHERAKGHTVILSTHDVELAAASVDRVVIMGEGQVVVDGPTREVMTESMVFSSQINKLFRDKRFLVVQDVLEVLA